MAKKKRAAVNKSLEIRQALTDNPGMKPKEIAAVLEAKGVHVTPAYVSIVKSNTKGKKKTKRVVRIMKRKASGGLGPLGAAIEFIRAAGGVQQAQRALAAIEELRRL